MGRELANRYPGQCTVCGGRVPTGAGLAEKTDGSWTVRHGSCPVEAPEAAVQPAATVKAWTPTAEQADCVAQFATGGDLVIQAGAGAGKSSTLLLLAEQARANGRRGQYCAYNSAIVKDIAAKVPGNVAANTLHSVAFRAYGHRFAKRLNAPRQRADETARLLGIDRFALPDADGKSKVLAAGFLAGLTMAAVRSFCTSADPEPGLRHFRYVEGLDMPDDNGNRTYTNNDELSRYLLPYAHKAWADLNDPDGRLRYSHDCYLKAYAMTDPNLGVDFLLLDEAQDADPVQAQIVKAQRWHGTQIVCVGDESQELYGWRGAVSALADFEAMGAQVAWLSQSFRFGDAVAEVANGLLGRLNARIRLRGFGPVASTVCPVAEPDCVLTRTNAGAVRRVLSEIEVGRKPHLVGGGSEVVSFCRGAEQLQTTGRTSHPELACFDSWLAVREFVDRDEQGDELRLMVKLIDEFGAKQIVGALERQPREGDADLVVSTAHKAKGREWDSVQIAPDFRAPKDGDLSPAELRLAYVASTRAKRELDITAVPHFGPGWEPAQTAKKED